MRAAQRTEVLGPNLFQAMAQTIGVVRESGVDVIDASRGNPDLPTAPHIVAAMQRAVADPENHRYAARNGKPRVLAAIAERYATDHGVRLDPIEQLAVFHGSQEALISALMAFVDPGTVVAGPDPGYPSYAAVSQLAGGSYLGVPLDPARDYRPDWTALPGETDIRVVLLNYPHNPTGALAAPGVFDEASERARERGALFVNDFAYADLVFDGHRAESALAGGRRAEHTLELSTLSKGYSMAGWRFGYAAGGAEAVRILRRYQAHGTGVLFGATQDTAAAALGGDRDAVAELVAVYARRRLVVTEGLRSLGWEFARTSGTFFIWARVPSGEDDVAFAQRLLVEHGVAFAPGSGFGPAGRGWLRIGLVHDETVLQDMIARLRDATGTTSA